MQNQVLEVRAVLGDLIDDGLAELIPLRVGPILSVDLGRAVLRKHRHHVFAGRGHGRIHQGGKQGVQVRILGPCAVFPVVVGPFHALQGVDEVKVRLEQLVPPGDGVKIRHAIQGDVDLSRRAADLEIAGAPDHLRGQIFFIQELQKGAFRIQIGDDDLGAAFIAVLQHDALDPALGDPDRFHAGLRLDLAAKSAQRASQRRSDGAHAAAGEAPGTDAAIHIPHVVMQQHISRARGVHAQGRANDAAARQMRLDDIGLKILV